MKKFTCPKCKVDTIPLKDKYLAGLWKTVYCSHCGAHLCALPLLMIPIYMAYTWALFLPIALAYFEKDLFPLIYVIPAWLILDYLNITLIPLAAMRKE